MSIKAIIEKKNNVARYFRTRDGVEINYSSDLWKFVANGGRHYLRFKEMRSLCGANLTETFKRLAEHKLKDQSPYTVVTDNETILNFVRKTISNGRSFEGKIETSHVIDYNSGLGVRRPQLFGRLSILLRAISDLGYEGVPADTYRLLLEMSGGRGRLGEAVLTHNPHVGPLSDVELEGLIAALDRGYAKGEVSREDFVLAWLFLATGRRTLQLSALKLKDFMVEITQDGTRFHWLNVPRAKQGGAGIRNSFRRFKLAPQVGELVEIFVAWRQQNDTKGLGIEAPFFLGDRIGGGPGLEWHTRAADLRKQLSLMVTLLDVTSPRTKQRLHVNPRRLRYTLGTRAAAEGANEFEIAELLDHSTSETARIYVKASPQMLERIDRAIAEQMAPFAQAFAGVLVDDEASARRGQDPVSRISDPTVVEDPVGTCGTYSFCSLSAPIACYTCINFQPWLDAPHEEILESLISKRQALIDRNGDIRIASINDRTILAVARVVQLCREKKVTAAAVGGAS